ncbi:MAG: chloride channel protein [Tidjanibacter sp.]|nr:chloride channel protein [Tidjanibacter sp.]
MTFIEKILMRISFLTRLLTRQQKMMILAVIIGIVAGLATYVFEQLLHFIEHGLVSWFNVDKAGWLYLAYPTVGIVAASLFVKHVIKDDISEGVTKVLFAMSKRDSRIKPHNCYSSMVGGALTIGFGGSVGPEAPIVLTGAAIGSNVGRLMKFNYRNTTLMLCCGVAATLAAVFKAPITGIVFVLEILMLDITMSAVVPLLISAVTATALTFFLDGFEPKFNPGITTFHLKNLPYYAIMAVACGFVSYYFKSMNSRISALVGKIKTQQGRWIIGGVALGILIFLFPPLYGAGYETMENMMHGNPEELFNNSLFYDFRNIPLVAIIYMLIIIFVKVIAMSITNAAGGVGGTFAPSLFVGAVTGGTIAFACNTWFGLDLPIGAFALVGMAGVMSGVMNAPLTSIFLIAELASGYGLFVPLMLVSSLSFGIEYYLDPDSIYTKKLRKNNELLTHNKDQAVLVFLNVDGLLETDFVPINENATLEDMTKCIMKATRNIFPVINDGNELMGIILLDDLRADMFDKSKYANPITNYMVPPPDTIMRKELLASVLDKFEASHAWNLPVVDKHNQYLGFISKSRILSAYRDKLVEMSQGE